MQLWTGGTRGRLTVVLLLAMASTTWAAEPTPSACVETKLSQPALDKTSIPLTTGITAGSEHWFSYKCADGESVWTGDLFVRNVTIASLTPFPPARSKATRVAVVVAPGGGTAVLDVDRQGYAVARWFAEQGIYAFVLKYRSVPTPTSQGGYGDVVRAVSPPFPTDRWHITPEQAQAEEQATLADAASAVRYIRERAATLGVDPQRVGVIGFSAGAYTALNVALRGGADRPNWVASFYGSLPGGATVTADAPPAFIAAASDDAQVPPLEDIKVYVSWKLANAPAELHMFQKGGHGFAAPASGNGADQWRSLLMNWLRQNGFLQSAR